MYVASQGLVKILHDTQYQLMLPAGGKERSVSFAKIGGASPDYYPNLVYTEATAVTRRTYTYAPHPARPRLDTHPATSYISFQMGTATLLLSFLVFVRIVRGIDFEPQWREFNRNVSFRSLGLPSDLFSKCTIDKVHVSRINGKQFRKKYQNKRPVIVTGIFLNKSLWSKKYVLSLGESERIQIDNSEIIAARGHAIVDQDMHSYINTHVDLYTNDSARLLSLVNETGDATYSFTNFYANEWPTMVKNFPVPHLFPTRKTRKSIEQFAFGTTGSGLYFHNHESVFNVVLVGSKLWLVSDPKKVSVVPEIDSF